MIDPNSTTRIIGDFLEVNADIVSEEFYSKKPKFIKKILSRKYRKRLLRAITKLKDSDYILNSMNLREYFIYVFNNCSGSNGGCYRSIKVVKYIEEVGEMEVIMIWDNYNIIFTFNNPEDEYFQMTVKWKENDNERRATVSLKDFRTNKYEFVDLYKTINIHIKDEICSYVEDIIKQYLEER